MAYSMSGEEKLAKELASRRISRFTDVIDVPSYLWCVILLALAAFFLLIHVAAFSEIYAVQLARFSGNYAETEATVVDYRNLNREGCEKSHGTDPRRTSSQRRTHEAFPELRPF